MILAWNTNDDFLIPSFLLRLLASILLRRAFLSHALLSLFSFWWQGVVIVWWILFKAVCYKQFLSLFFLILKLSQMWPGRAPSSALFCPSDIILLTLENFLAFRHNGILRYHLHFPCLRSGISHFSKNLCFLWVESGIKKPNMCVACIFIFGEIIPIEPLISDQHQENLLK